ncbi:hypothetical protein KIPB_012427, partial [Kipferlia bialata]|eukprot:g12427.t1
MDFVTVPSLSAEQVALADHPHPHVTGWDYKSAT